MSSQINLSSLDGTNGFTILGENNGGQSGYSVAGLGDVNGDNISDILITAPFVASGGSNRGKAYVVFGQSTPWNNSFDLSDLDGTNGFSINGEGDFNFLGFNVSRIDNLDINQDGIRDIVIGSHGFNSGNGQGKAYIIFGQSTPWNSSFSLSALDGNNGFTFSGPSTNELGIAVAGLDDINGDNISDLLIGSTSNSHRGRSYVIFGKTTGWDSTINTTNLNGANGFSLNGENPSDFSGSYLTGLGDINNDGIKDLLITAPRADLGGTDRGKSYVVFGQSTPWNSSFNLSSLDGTNGFSLLGENDNDQSGSSVARLGDINGDGISDLAVGSVNANSLSGKTYVVFGQSTPFSSTINLSSLDGTNGFIINGISGEQSSYSIAGIDFNGDNLGDIAIGSSSNGSTKNRYIVFGQSTPWNSTLDLSTIDETNGIKIIRENSGDFAGGGVSSLGDVNGDGLNDLLIGSPSADQSNGKSYVIFSVIDGGGQAFNIIDGTTKNNTLIGTAGPDMINGLEGDDHIDGQGGADILNGGDGDDTFFIADFNFISINGGEGIDTLRFNASPLNLDLTNAPPSISDIEIIDLTETGMNTITSNPNNIHSLSSNSILYINKGIEDQVNIDVAEWTLSPNPYYYNGKYYQEYTQQGPAEVKAILRVEQAIANVIPPTPTATGSFLVNGILGSSDLLIGTAVSDRINGRDGDDIVVGRGGADILYGGSQADTFVYEDYSDSLLGSVDRIVDFKQEDGDRFQFVPDTLNGLFNAGTVNGLTLNDAINAAYADKSIDAGIQQLQNNEAVFFKYGPRTYLSINNNNNGFQSGLDTLIEVTGINYQTGDTNLGTLNLNDYFLA